MIKELAKFVGVILGSMILNAPAIVILVWCLAVRKENK